MKNRVGWKYVKRVLLALLILLCVNLGASSAWTAENRGVSTGQTQR